MSDKKEKITEDVKELILARIDLMPANYKLSVGNMGTFTKEQLINNVREGSEVGIQVINMQLNFIKALTSGKLLETLNQND